MIGLAVGASEVGGWWCNTLFQALFAVVAFFTACAVVLSVRRWGIVYRGWKPYPTHADKMAVESAKRERLRGERELLNEVISECQKATQLLTEEITLGFWVGRNIQTDAWIANSGYLESPRAFPEEARGAIAKAREEIQWRNETAGERWEAFTGRESRRPAPTVLPPDTAELQKVREAVQAAETALHERLFLVFDEAIPSLPWWYRLLFWRRQP